MIKVITAEKTVRQDVAPARAPHPAMPGYVAEVVLDRATVAGSFSLFAHGPFAIDSEPGLVIRVHAGCLWVPHAEENCSVGAGEERVVHHNGRLTVFGSHGTEVELVRPAAQRSAAGLH